MDWQVWIATVLGIWGAMLSTFNFLKSRTNVRLVAWEGVVSLDQQGSDFTEKVVITVENVGGTSVTIADCGLLLSNNYTKTYISFEPLCSERIVRSVRRLPKSGDTYDFYKEKNELKPYKFGSPDTYVAYVKDATGRFFYSHDPLTRYIRLGRLKHKDDKSS